LVVQSPTHRPANRLNAKALAFEPKLAEDPVPGKFQQYKHQCSKVIRSAVNELNKLEGVSNVALTDDPQEYVITIQLHGEANAETTEDALNFAKQALLTATGQSKCVYIMGYCSPQPFTMGAQGFEGCFGAMENARQACWHVFKKGFCQHGDACSKQHPVFKIPIRVLVEAARFDAPSVCVTDFKLRVLDIVTTVTSTLEENAYVEEVTACKDRLSKCWRIELSPKEHSPAHNDHMMTLAKSAVLTATSTSKFVRLLGKSAKPFLPKSGGFVAMLGDMQAENRACWDFYSLGSCRRECACRWEHPTCLIPVIFTVKQN
jgi:hypothetical protein